MSISLCLFQGFVQGYETVVFYGMGLLAVWPTTCLEDQDVMLGFAHLGRAMSGHLPRPVWLG